MWKLLLGNVLFKCILTFYWKQGRRFYFDLQMCFFLENITLMRVLNYNPDTFDNYLHIFWLHDQNYCHFNQLRLFWMALLVSSI